MRFQFKSAISYPYWKLKLNQGLKGDRKGIPWVFLLYICTMIDL